jgi:Tfp pilus assembly protein PilF
MAYLKTGNPQAAKDSLANALKLSESFTGVEEAKRVLADLN